MRSPRWRRFREVIVLAVAALFLTTSAGCFGRFRAMNGLYDFNKSASSNGVVRSLLMCAMIIIPVYEVGFLVDALVLNTMDFFNGTNQVARRERLPDGGEIYVAKVDADTVRVRHVAPLGRTTSFDVVRVGANAGFVRAADGRILGAAERLADGRVVRRAP